MPVCVEDAEIVLLEVMDDETEVIDETVYEDFAVSELDTDMSEEPVETMVEDAEAETVIVDVGVSFELALPGAVIELVRDDELIDDPLTDDELDE